MTALEFVASGVVFETGPEGRLRVLAPKGSDLIEQVRFEVATRLELVREDALRWVKLAHCCDVCGDQIGHDHKGRCALCGMKSPKGKRLCRFVFGGMCDLCVLARQKALRKKDASSV